MSGGFYGMSHSLVNRIMKHPNRHHYTVGIEDLQMGHLIADVVGESVEVVHFDNGVHWCHFKDRNSCTFEKLSGKSAFDTSECDKRR